MVKKLILLFLIAFLFSCKKETSIKEKKTPTVTLKKYNLPIVNCTIKSLVKDSTVNQNYKKEISFINQFFKTNFSQRFGGQFLVIKDNYILYDTLKGYSDYKTKAPLKSTTPIHVASTSKTFTALAILKLVEAKKINLTDSIQYFFPELKYYKGITIKNLLNHRAGLPNYVYFTDDEFYWSNKQKYLTNKDLIEILATKNPPVNFKADTRFNYSNTNYAILASVVEKVTKIPFHKVIEELFFKPLQMKNSFVFQLKDTLNIPPSHDYKGRHWALNFQDGIVGDKNIYTTSHDLAKWHQALMHPNFINDSLRQAAFTPYSFEKQGIKNYGLGFRMLIDSENKNSSKLIFHNGLWHGNNACFVHLPKQNIAIIAIGNKFSRVVYQAMTIANVFGDYLIGIPEIEEKKIENSIQIDSIDKPRPVLEKIKNPIIKTKKSKDSIFIKLKDSIRKQPKIEKDSVIELQKIELDSLNNVTI